MSRCVFYSVVITSIRFYCSVLSRCVFACIRRGHHKTHVMEGPNKIVLYCIVLYQRRNHGRRSTAPQQTDCAPQETDCAPQQTDCTPQQTDCSPQQTICAPQQTDYAPQETDCAPQHRLRPSTDGLRPSTDGLLPSTDRLRPSTDGFRPQQTEYVTVFIIAPPEAMPSGKEGEENVKHPHLYHIMIHSYMDNSSTTVIQDSYHDIFMKAV